MRMIPTLWTNRLSSPISGLNEMQREMDRLFGVWSGGADAQSWALPADVRETDDAIEYAIEIPGLRAEDIELTVENGVLTVAGEKKFESEQGSRDDGYRLLERRYGRFERSFRVPTNVKSDEVEATYDNGVLTVSLPKTEESRPRRIRISSGNGSRQVGTGSNA